MRLYINNGSTDRLTTEITIEEGRDFIPNGRIYTVSPNWNAKGDPLLSGLSSFWQKRIRCRYNYESVLKIKTYPIHIKKNKGYFINGTRIGIKGMSMVLARLTYASCLEQSDSKMTSIFIDAMNIPEQVSYALENRAPYSFYENYTLQEVRLNVEPIGNKKYAIEISDSIWGEISQRDLVTFVNTYRDNLKRGSWSQLSPKKLYGKLMQAEPSDSELKVMKAFLSQNRTQDIVEKRAKELIQETCDLMPNNFFYYKIDVEENGTIEKAGLKITNQDNEWLFIRGRKYDWMIRKASNRASRQSVNTFVYNQVTKREKTGQIKNEEGVWVDTYEEITSFQWRGPICVDNLAFNGAQSIGDQMVARAYAFLNDSVTINLVSTINSYLNKKDMSENRLDFEGMIMDDVESLICPV